MTLVLKRSTAACIAALAVAGCGGGSTAGDNTATAKTLTLSGTAATGLAMSGSAVAVKCAVGAGNATTAANGNYSIAITDGALPCIIEVNGTVNGTDVKLHSVTEAGTASGNNIAAVANVTPLTELIVAKLAAALPADVFASFGAQTTISAAALSAATNAVVIALKDATGIDLGTIDPFKATLVAATPAAPTAGNPYDRVLDALKDKVPVAALAQVVAQVATTTTNSGDNTITLHDVMAGVNNGSLAGCPSAVSGKYRMIDYFGRTRVRILDFKALEWKTADGVKMYDIVPSPTEACRFTAQGSYDGQQARLDVVIGRAGAGSYRSENLSASPVRSAIGYLFPVQAHAVATIAGNWNFVQSGYMPDDKYTHYLGQLTVGANGNLAVCDYTASGTCIPDAGAPTQITARADGSFNVTQGTFSVPFYAYRAPNGTVTLFGTSNPDGVNTIDAEQTHLIATRVQHLTLPTVSTAETRYWDLNQVRIAGVNTAVPFQSDGTSVIAIADAAAGAFKRKRTSDGREDVMTINKPYVGWRSRPASTWNNVGVAGVNQLLINGLGMTISTNSIPAMADNNYASHVYAVSVTRP